MAFLGISILVIVVPGQDTALTIRNTLLGGRRSGSYTAVGVVSGLAIWTTATSVGLAGILLASQPAFLALKILGTLYLAWLGLRALREAFRPERLGGTEERRQRTRPDPGTISSLRAFRQGVVSNLSNPKIAVFFVSLLPQFAPPGRAALPAMLSLGLVFCLLTLCWLVAYAAVVARIGDVLRRSTVRRLLHGVMGGVFLGLGFRLATTQR